MACSFTFSISTKRDMCVPLNCCGRCTYILNMAMVCCSPADLSLTTIGWRMALMPTLSMAIWRVSKVFCTSSIGQVGVACVITYPGWRLADNT